MLGAVFGDIVGSAYEWDNVKTKDFPLITPNTRYTDDSVMTLSVAQWLMDDPEHTEARLIKTMQRFGRRHYKAGYGGRFKEWIQSKDPQTYNSWGNGSAMRVSPVGLYASSLEEALELARLSASVTHNHPEGIKGAMAVAECVFWNKDRNNGLWSSESTKVMLKNIIQDKYGYDLSRTLDEIRPDYKFDVSSNESSQVTMRVLIFRSFYYINDVNFKNTRKMMKIEKWVEEFERIVPVDDQNMTSEEMSFHCLQGVSFVIDKMVNVGVRYLLRAGQEGDSEPKKENSWCDVHELCKRYQELDKSKVLSRAWRLSNNFPFHGEFKCKIRYYTPDVERWIGERMRKKC